MVSVDVFETEVRVEVFGEMEGAYQFVKDTSLVINLMGHCELGGAELGVREQHSNKAIDSSLLNREGTHEPQNLHEDKPVESHGEEDCSLKIDILFFEFFPLLLVGVSEVVNEELVQEGQEGVDEGH